MSSSIDTGGARLGLKTFGGSASRVARFSPVAFAMIARLVAELALDGSYVLGFARSPV
jgi:hypothetical protein